MRVRTEAYQGLRFLDNSVTACASAQTGLHQCVKGVQTWIVLDSVYPAQTKLFMQV